MPKPIKFTEDLIKQVISEFEESVRAIKMTDGSVKYNKNFTYKDEIKARVMFTPMAFAKMSQLLLSFDSEVAWHGVGERTEGANFLITDILVYPQTVTGSTVEMDTEEYAMWLMKNADDERFDNIIMQGHSHVNAGTTPSSVDLTHMEQILEQLKDDMYYIFMIWNKKFDRTIKIYDMQNNVLYENGDIEYTVVDEGTSLDEFIGEAKEIVKKKATIYQSSYGYTSGYYKDETSDGNTKKNPAKKETAGTKTKSKKKEKPAFGNGWQGRGYSAMDDEAYGFLCR